MNEEEAQRNGTDAVKHAYVQTTVNLWAVFERVREAYVNYSIDLADFNWVYDHLVATYESAYLTLTCHPDAPNPYDESVFDQWVSTYGDGTPTHYLRCTDRRDSKVMKSASDVFDVDLPWRPDVRWAGESKGVSFMAFGPRPAGWEIVVVEPPFSRRPPGAAVAPSAPALPPPPWLAEDAAFTTNVHWAGLSAKLMPTKPTTSTAKAARPRTKRSARKASRGASARGPKVHDGLPNGSP